MLAPVVVMAGPAAAGNALATTCVVFLGLSAYASTTKRDFSYLGAFVYTAILALIVGMLLNTFVFHSAAAQGAFAVVGAFIFSAAILFDVWRLSRTQAFNEPIPFALTIYLDFINLFLSLLQISRATPQLISGPRPLESNSGASPRTNAAEAPVACSATSKGRASASCGSAPTRSPTTSSWGWCSRRQRGARPASALLSRLGGLAPLSQRSIDELVGRCIGLGRAAAVVSALSSRKSRPGGRRQAPRAADGARRL